MSKFLDAVGLARFKDKLESKWKLKFDQVYNKTEVDELITAKVAEIVAGAPDDFNTLKEMSDWLAEHEDSAAAMNTAIQKNTDDITSANTEIAKKVDKVAGKSLISDSEITRLAGVDNYDDSAVNTQIADIYNRCGGGKNLLKLSTSPAAQMGVRVTTNPTDGTVTIKGALTGDFAYFVIGKYTFVAGVTYILIDNSFNSGLSYCYLNGNNKEFTKSGTLFTPTETQSILVYYRARKSITYDNIHYPMIVEKSVVDKTFAPYVSTNKELQERIDTHESETKSQAAINRTTLGTQCKNLLNPDKHTINKCTEEKDGDTYTVTNTGTWSQWYWAFKGCAGQKYILTCDISELTGDTSYNETFIEDVTNNKNISGFSTRVNGQRTVGFTAISDGNIKVRWCPNNSGTDRELSFKVSNLMCRSADITDNTYEPYIPSLQEQINTHESETKSQDAVIKTTLGTQCKNLLPYRCIPHNNSGGIKVAVADDGVVTLSGTNTVSFTHNINFTTPMVFDRDVFIIGAKKLSNVNYNCKVDIKVNGSNYPAIGTNGLRIPAGTSIQYLYFQQQTTGKTIDATIEPMIVYADVLDRTYEPYKPSLQEQISQLVARIEALEGSTATTEE